jgi:hypothetical protein
VRPVVPAGKPEPERASHHAAPHTTADLLHPPDVQLQVRPLEGQRVRAALGAPGQVTAEIGFGVLAGGAFEASKVGGYCQPRLVSERRQRIGRH